MTTVATIVCLALALVTVLAGGLRALRDRPVTAFELGAAGLLEVGVLLYVAVRAVDLVGGHRPPSTGLVLAYLVGIALTMPVAAALAIAERSRWGPTVLVAGAVVVCVLFARVDQIWTARG